MTAADPLVEQVVRLLDIRLLDPLEILLDGDDAVAAVRQLVRLRAARWATVLRGADEAAAATAAIRLVATLYPGDRPFDPPPEWWSSPLGRVVALRVGHPAAESVSYAVAGAMLGITRQGVHDLVRRGKLPRHPDGGVPTRAVRDRLREQPSRSQPGRSQPGRSQPGRSQPSRSQPDREQPGRDLVVRARRDGEQQSIRARPDNEQQIPRGHRPGGEQGTEGEQS